jgi:mannose-1-phosphate guanylyltransferase/mannose-6-phosphate isomerase
MGAKIDEAAFEIDGFTEKPEKKKAEEYLASGKYLWNAGIFIAKASVMEKEFMTFVPELKPLFSTSETEEIYSKLDSVSIDQGLLEKTKNIAVVPTDAAWNDLGSWGSIYDISPKDKNANYLEGNVVCEDTAGSLILARANRRIATIGLENVVVVDTEDVTLVCDRDRGQDVKKIVDKIKLEPGSKDYIEHKTMHRPWGRYTILDEADGFKVKFIHVEPGAKLSLQSHSHRSEHWVVVKGEAKVTIGEEFKILRPNESIFVPVETKHRLENIGKTELTIVEVATGDYIEEDDIKRYEDVYERV